MMEHMFYTLTWKTVSVLFKFTRSMAQSNTSATHDFTYTLLFLLHFLIEEQCIRFLGLVFLNNLLNNEEKSKSKKLLWEKDL